MMPCSGFLRCFVVCLCLLFISWNFLGGAVGFRPLALQAIGKKKKNNSILWCEFYGDVDLILIVLFNFDLGAKWIEKEP